MSTPHPIRIADVFVYHMSPVCCRHCATRFETREAWGAHAIVRTHCPACGCPMAEAMNAWATVGEGERARGWEPVADGLPIATGVSVVASTTSESDEAWRRRIVDGYRADPVTLVRCECGHLTDARVGYAPDARATREAVGPHHTPVRCMMYRKAGAT